MADSETNNPLEVQKSEELANDESEAELLRGLGEIERNEGQYTFRVQTPRAGVEWVEDLQRSQWMAADAKDKIDLPLLVPDYDQSSDSYSPLGEFPVLFLTFSELDGSQESLVEFASKFGLLGLNEEVSLKRNTTELECGASITLAESANVWRQAILEMKVTVNIWNKLKRHESDSLKSVIVWSKNHENDIEYDSVSVQIPKTDADYHLDTVSSFPGILFHRTIASRSTVSRFNLSNPNFYKFLKPEELLQPATIFVMQQVNQHLERSVWPYLEIDGTKKRYRPTYTISNLLSAMWLQFYNVLTGELKVRRCQVCHGWMDVTRRNTNKKVHAKCSDRLRNAKFRSRKDYDKGKTAAKIAEQRSMNLETVQQWFTEWSQEDCDSG